MSAPYHVLGQWDADVLIVADHASNHVPEGIDLGIDPALRHEHVAIDIGVAGVARHLVAGWGYAAILGGVSRLVIDYNREPDAAALVPVASDGHEIPGNRGIDIGERIARYHAPYHHQVAALAGMDHAPFILSLHSFTPGLRSRPDEVRPWEIGILYNEDDRAPRLAIPALQGAGLVVGDQEPYSGKILNATMNRHAEAHGRPYLGVEIRQDLIRNEAGQARFAAILGPLLGYLRQALR
jgi:predicted N-formylglutamate amidohydrolase